MDYFYYLMFVLGLGFGSFFNVVSIRFNPDQKLFDPKIIGGRSRCPYCRKQLAWYELVPVISFLIQRRRCRSCAGIISAQYPLVELLTGLIFVLVPLNLKNFNAFSGAGHFVLTSFIWLSIFSLLIVLSITDFRHFIIPDEISIILAVLGIGLMILAGSGSPAIPENGFVSDSFLGHYALLFGSFGNVWANHAVAAVLAAVFFGLIIVLSRGKAMGWGDFKLAGALGLIFGWPDILAVLAFSFVAGAAFSVFLMANKKKKMKDEVPFGPFLAIGSALTFFLGYNIINAYFKMFGI